MLHYVTLEASLIILCRVEHPRWCRSCLTCYLEGLGVGEDQVAQGTRHPKYFIHTFAIEAGFWVLFSLTTVLGMRACGDGAHRASAGVRFQRILFSFGAKVHLIWGEAALPRKVLRSLEEENIPGFWPINVSSRIRSRGADFFSAGQSIQDRLRGCQAEMVNPDTQ